MSAFHHRYATRLNSFGPAQSVATVLPALAAIDGLTALEVNFPEHITRQSAPEFLALGHDHGLDVTALNLRYDPRRFVRGAFTNPDPALRAAARSITHDALETARTHAIPHVILWMGPDGFDYSFASDYTTIWQFEIDTIRDLTLAFPEINISVEYKPSDPRRFSLVRSMAESLLAAAAVNAANLGVTLDFCHSLMAGENPASAAALALRCGKLFGLHLNDGYGPADDGLMVGSVHEMATLELLWTLRQFNWTGPIYFDTFPTTVTPDAECRANIAAVERLECALDRVNGEALRAAQVAQDAVAALAEVRRALDA